MKKELINSGNVKCILEPMGKNGLEGYGLDEVYFFEEFPEFYVLFPSKYDKDICFPGYTETCGKGIFKKYFKIVEKYANKK